jgi:hypothetical protein
MAVVLVMIPSCSTAEKGLPIPEASSISQMVVSWRGEDGQERGSVVDDPKAIEHILQFLQNHNDGWRKPWDTFPTSQYSIALKQDTKLILVIWVGTDWIGGREGDGDAEDNRLHSLSEPERAEMLGILGIPRA